MKHVEELIRKYEATVLEHYHWLHAHPELSGEEKETAAYVAAQLRKMGLEPKEHVGGYGVTAVIQGKGPGKCIGLRADFDALPMTERTGLPFASQNPGIMHSCGHDTHAAMLLGTAQVLLDLRDTFDGCVKLLFQPSEENAADSGAKRMIADGALENPHVDAVIGQHIDPWTDTGSVCTRDSAASDRFFITVEGESSHAARPHMGVDAIAVAVQIASALQNIVSRNVNPLESSVITIGKITGGDRYNVLASHVEMEGTCRNRSIAVRDMVEKRMESIVTGVAASMGAKGTFRYVRGYSAIINDPGMMELVREVSEELLGSENVTIPNTPSMGGEDFSFFAEKVPGVFYRTGCHKVSEPVYSTHSEYMIVDPGCFPIGMQIMVESVLKYLGRNQ
ncbi:MAG: amidohydrolase [Ruminococcaceae bacterium]|nr:amidohydrolase [Oscillospiraceae bacterium]